jgi:hypothetical protein
MQAVREGEKGVDSSDMRIATGRSGFRAHFWRKSMRMVGLATVVLLALAQVGAFVHFALVGHALSLDTGTLVHCDYNVSPSPNDRTPPSSRHETCEIFAVLCQASTIASPVPTVATPDVVIHAWPRVPDDEALINPWPIYMLAPSHSPPGMTI